MENDNNNWIIAVLVILLISAWSSKHKANVEIARLHSEVTQCQDSLDEANSNLDEANSNLDEANSNIEDAQSYAWSSYEDMGYALESLETVN